MRLSVAIRPQNAEERREAAEFAKKNGATVAAEGDVIFVIEGIPLEALIGVVTEAEAFPNKALFYYST